MNFESIEQVDELDTYNESAIAWVSYGIKDDIPTSLSHEELIPLEDNCFDLSADYKYEIADVTVPGTSSSVPPKIRQPRYGFENSSYKRHKYKYKLLNRLERTIDEFNTRIGQQAVVLVVGPGAAHASYKVFGSQPLQGIVKSFRSHVTKELQIAVAAQALRSKLYDQTVFDLPPIAVEGETIPLVKMTQTHLRSFIPKMLKYSTGRCKPGWGKECFVPPWWPPDFPWKNIRKDNRSDEDKLKRSWSECLRQIIVNCYRYHRREDLLSVCWREEGNDGDQELDMGLSVLRSSDTVTNPEQEDKMQTDENCIVISENEAKINPNEDPMGIDTKIEMIDLNCLSKIKTVDFKDGSIVERENNDERNFVGALLDLDHQNVSSTDSAPAAVVKLPVKESKEESPALVNLEECIPVYVVCSDLDEQTFILPDSENQYLQQLLL